MLKASLVILFLIALTQNSGAAIPIYYWDNQEGLVAADSCAIAGERSTRFRISTYSGRLQKNTENLRNFELVRQSHLVNGSLVKLVEGRKRPRYSKVEVVGVNQDPVVARNRWYSERGDEGYLFEQSLLPAEDFVLKVYSDYAIPGMEGRKTKGTYWRIASEAHYFHLICEDIFETREYTVFRVYDEKNIEHPIALVGVYWNETDIFSDFQSFPIQSAIDLVPALKVDATIAELLELDSVNSINPLPVPLPIPKPDISPEPPVRDLITQVICSASDTLNVRAEGLDSIVFKAKTGEPVLVYESWDEEENPQLLIDGVLYDYVRVLFPEREEEDQKMGYVPARFIKAKDKCKYLPGHQRVIDPHAEIGGIDDNKCCEFPTVKKPTHAFNSGMRKFNAPRSYGKRLHAACDLYRYKDEPALSVAPGKVLRNLYYFYQGTYALEILHSGGFVVRYGELTGKRPKHVSAGQSVNMGQNVGYIGKVNSNCCRPMLHFELFSGKAKGPLSQNGNKYSRRSDLLDPTAYLLKWQSDKF